MSAPSPTTVRSLRRARLLAIPLTLLALAAVVVGGRDLVDFVQEPFGGRDGCTVTASGQEIELSAEQARAATAAAAAAELRGQGRAVLLTGIATATDLRGDDARAVLAAVTGRSRAALSCAGIDAPGVSSPALDDLGLTSRARTVLERVRSEFGNPPTGGFAPGGVSTGHMPGSAHYSGRAVDVFYRPITPDNKALGWALSHYLVAHAEELRIRTVIYDDRIWTARRAGQGWRDYRVDTDGRDPRTAAILEHRDHVHVDVAP